MDNKIVPNQLMTLWRKRRETQEIQTPPPELPRPCRGVLVQREGESPSVGVRCWLKKINTSTKNSALRE